MSTTCITTRSEAETRAVARDMAARLRPGDLVALEGPLGAGKTCFVRGLAEGLGIDPYEVTSPTFLLCHEYRAGEGEDGVALVHLDGYRLTGPDDLETIGWDENLQAERTIIAVEWAERFGAMLPAERVGVQIAHVDQSVRELTINAPASLEDRLGSTGSGGSASSVTSNACRICGKAIAADAGSWPFCSSRCRLVDLGQ